MWIHSLIHALYVTLLISGWCLGSAFFIPYCLGHAFYVRIEFYCRADVDPYVLLGSIDRIYVVISD
jgi:hypothetical protein